MIIRKVESRDGLRGAVVTVELEDHDEDALMEAFLIKTWGWGEENEGYGKHRGFVDPEKSLAEARAWQDGSDPWLFDHRPKGQVCLNRDHVTIEHCKAQHRACVIGREGDERVSVSEVEIDGEVNYAYAVPED